MKNSLIWIAILLVVLWVVARLVLAITSVALNLLWVIAIVAAIVWVVSRFKSRAGLAGRQARCDDTSGRADLVEGDASSSPSSK